MTTQNTDKALDVIVCPDPALSECSDIDSDSDANEQSNKQLPDNTDDESSMNNDKSVLRVEKKKRKTPKQNRTFACITT